MDVLSFLLFSGKHVCTFVLVLGIICYPFIRLEDSDMVTETGFDVLGKNLYKFGNPSHKNSDDFPPICFTSAM